MLQTALRHAFDRMMTKQATKNPMKSMACNAAWCFAALVSGGTFLACHVCNPSGGGRNGHPAFLYV
jgi:hypothetical protein